MKMTDWINEFLSTIGIILGVDISTTKDILGIVLVVVNIIILLISTTFKLIKWYKEAKSDGHISSDEMQDAINIIDDAKDKIDNHDKGGK